MTFVLASPEQPRHRPVETCAVCEQPWPCLDEQARVRAVEAALKAKDVPPETVDEKEKSDESQ